MPQHAQRENTVQRSSAVITGLCRLRKQNLQKRTMAMNNCRFLQ